MVKNIKEVGQEIRKKVKDSIATKTAIVIKGSGRTTDDRVSGK